MRFKRMTAIAAIAVVAFGSASCGKKEEAAAPTSKFAEGTTMDKIVKANKLNAGTKWDQALWGLKGLAKAPEGATAQCRDGAYSFSQRASGSCSGHGGVAQWLATARCNDGTLSLSQTMAGTCSAHQGVKVWYIKGVCNDGTVTRAATRQGACSQHGGIAQWLVEEES